MMKSKRQLVPMEFEASKRAIAKIHYKNNNDIAGTGFLIAERYLLTCAHVVKEALFARENIEGSFLDVTFFDTIQPKQAEVIFYDLDELNYGRDTALLYLPEASQLVVSPLSVCTLQKVDGTTLKIFGYPGNDAAGRNLTAITTGEVDGGWIQVEDTKVPGLSIEAGLSGSPVWGKAEQAIVGMVVARHEGQDQAKVGFIISSQKLQAAQKAIRCHSLLALLEPYKETFSEQITTAYKVCRPDTWLAPFQSQLEQQLKDLIQMSENKLVEFTACLWNQPGTECLQADLLAWVERYKNDSINFSELLLKMKEQQEKVAPGALQTFEPCLLISVQADRNTQKEPYQINAWVVPNTRRYNSATREGYNPATGEGADSLKIAALEDYMGASDDSIDLESGIGYEHLPILLADYLEQVADRGISLEDLTIEFFLPMSLLNQPIEQCSVPAKYGFPTPLGVDEDCAHVVVRSQERLEFARGRQAWETKWNRLQDESHTAAIDAFLDGDELSPRALQKPLKSALGLRLTKKLPKAEGQGEIGVLLATGTPAAIWLRSHACGLADQLHDEILDGCLTQVPTKVCSLRRNTSALDEEADPKSSTELGHHLSFLWEDFYRVPPSIVYSDANL